MSYFQEINFACGILTAHFEKPLQERRQNKGKDRMTDFCPLLGLPDRKRHNV